jgi:hypothetical protein
VVFIAVVSVATFVAVEDEGATVGADPLSLAARLLTALAIYADLRITQPATILNDLIERTERRLITA